MNENSEEQRARQWLEDQRYTDFCDLTKDRKDPPDFAVASRIGVEVRQLTWMTDTATRENQEAEELEKPLERAIRKVLQDAGELPGGYSVSVSCDLLDTFLPKPKVTRQQVGKAVDDYVALLDKALQSGGNPESWRAHLKCKLDMHFQPFSTSGPDEFILMQVEAATHLRGWVVKDSIDNANRCIVDKAGKIKADFTSNRSGGSCCRPTTFSRREVGKRTNGKQFATACWIRSPGRESLSSIGRTPKRTSI